MHGPTAAPASGTRSSWGDRRETEPPRPPLRPRPTPRTRGRSCPRGWPRSPVRSRSAPASIASIAARSSSRESDCPGPAALRPRRACNSGGRSWASIADNAPRVPHARWSGFVRVSPHRNLSTCVHNWSQRLEMRQPPKTVAIPRSSPLRKGRFPPPRPRIRAASEIASRQRKERARLSRSRDGLLVGGWVVRDRLRHPSGLCPTFEPEQFGDGWERLLNLAQITGQSWGTDSFEPCASVRVRVRVPRVRLRLHLLETADRGSHSASTLYASDGRGFRIKANSIADRGNVCKGHTPPAPLFHSASRTIALRGEGTAPKTQPPAPLATYRGGAIDGAASRRGQAASGPVRTRIIRCRSPASAAPRSASPTRPPGAPAGCSCAEGRRDGRSA